tara:strand:- start:171 stop:503 length:333 start_codon:yes stop_codon:yes gene_type:complete
MSVSNVINHTMVVEKHVIRPVTIMPLSKKKSLFAVSVLQSPLVVVKKHVKLMEPISSNTNANSAATYHNGSVGVILISVNHAIRDNALVITFLERVGTSLINALVRRSVL